MRLTTSVATVMIMIAPAYGHAQSAEPGTGADDVPLPATIPIFPLPDVALLPDMTLPLHIFEERYHTMVADALDGDRMIGMVMLRPGYEAEYEGRPPVHSIGGAGRIESSERLPDGRYIILLRGVTKFRIVSEDASRPYRLAEVAAIPEELAAQDRALLGERRDRLEELLLAVSADAELPSRSVSDEDAVNIFAQFLPLGPTDRQMLLETEGVLARSEALIRLLEAMLPMPRSE